MSTPEIPQPHDGLVRYAFSAPENAASLLRAHLPPALVAALDWNQLRLESGSFVSAELRQSESDLLYHVPIAGEDEHAVFLYVLFEHQSTCDLRLPRRLLSYMEAIWRRFEQEHGFQRQLPLIIPLVLAQVTGGWQASPQFADLLHWPAGLRPVLERFMPRFEHLLIDLAEADKDDLRGSAEARLVQALLKAAMEKELLSWVEWALPLLRALQSPDMLRALFLYAANAESDLDLQQLAARVSFERAPQVAETIMSIAEKIRIEARSEGRSEGRVEGALIGQLQALQRLLGQPELPADSYLKSTPAELAQHVADLERKLRERLR